MSIESDLVPLLGAEDVFVDSLTKANLTSVVTYYQYFSKLKQKITQDKRVAKVIQTEINIDKMINDYESFTSDLLASIESVTAVLGDKQFVNSLREVQRQLGHFNAYKNAKNHQCSWRRATLRCSSSPSSPR